MKLKKKGLIYICFLIGLTKGDVQNAQVFGRQFNIPPEENKQEESNNEKMNEEACWVGLSVKKHFTTMDTLDDKYQQVRNEFQAAVTSVKLDERMLDMMLQSRAGAEREVHRVDGNPSKIPAGINLGGYCLMIQQTSILFFHRLKLRNETRFRVDALKNDVFKMALFSNLTLNDLHLVGSYERALSENNDNDSLKLFYQPTFGEIEFLLKDVKYTVEGRFRLVQRRLRIEHVLSRLILSDVLMMYRTNGSSNCESLEKIDPTRILAFVERLRADLDTWLQDYFNDYLMYFELPAAATNQELIKYESEKTMILNDFVDQSIVLLKERLHSLKPSAADVKIPSVSIISISGLQISLHAGVIRGFDSFFRQSVATGRRKGESRVVNAILGFSGIKIEYKYLAKINNKMPPLTGLIVLSADELITHMGIGLNKDPERVQLIFSEIKQNRPSSLVVEGALNRLISNFRHLLEDQIIAVMLHSLYYNIRMLETLTKCKPSLTGHLDNGDNANSDADKFDDLQNKGGYALTRNDSIEMVIPADEKHLAKKVHIRYKEKFELNQTDTEDGGPPSGEKDISKNPPTSDSKEDSLNKNMYSDVNEFPLAVQSKEANFDKQMQLDINKFPLADLSKEASFDKQMQLDINKFPLADLSKEASFDKEMQLDLHIPPLDPNTRRKSHSHKKKKKSTKNKSKKKSKKHKKHKKAHHH